MSQNMTSVGDIDNIAVIDRDKKKWSHFCVEKTVLGNEGEHLTWTVPLFCL